MERTLSCATTAGLIGDHKLHIVSEPEAGALHTLEAVNLLGIYVGDAFVVCDAISSLFLVLSDGNNMGGIQVGECFVCTSVLRTSVRNVPYVQYVQYEFVDRGLYRELPADLQGCRDQPPP